MIRLWAVAGDCSLWRSVDQCNIVYPGNHAMELVSRPDAKPLHVKVVPDPSSGSIHNGNQKMKPSVRDDDSSKERESVALAPDGISKEVSSAQGTPAVRGVEVQCTKTSQGSAMEDLKPGNFVKSKGQVLMYCFERWPTKAPLPV